MKFCTKCGNPIVSDVKFCTKCGNPIKNTDIDNEKSEESKIDLSKKEIDMTIPDIKISKEDKEQFTQESLGGDEEYSKSGSIEDTIRNHIDEKIDFNNISNVNNEHIENKPRNNKKANNQYINNKRENSGSEKTFFSGAIPKIIIAVVLIAAILAGIFFNRIRGEYYIMKTNDAVNVTEKLEYATKAVKVLNTSETKDLLKAVIVEIAKNDVELAEQKLNEVSSMISQSDFQNIAIGIKDKKVDKLYKDGKYQEAVAEFSEIDKLGGDFKTNKNYEDIILNVISKITNTPLSNTKNLLMEDRKIYFDNFDDDPFDEIIELKSSGSYSYNAELRLNLYKVKNGQYRLVDTETIEHAWNQKIQGVYNYDTDKKGIYISYSNASNSTGTSVFGVSNDKLQLKGTIFANNYTKPDDVDNDGIYEILSNSTSVVTSDRKDVSKWYKVYDDGRTPTEVTASGGEKTKTSTSSSDYIFKDSDKSYLTEDDMNSISKDQRAFARNEIFARHGYVFNDEQYKKYFTAKSWYVPNPSYKGDDSALNQYEIANYKLIQAWENK